MKIETDTDGWETNRQLFLWVLCIQGEGKKVEVAAICFHKLISVYIYEYSILTRESAIRKTYM